MIDTQDPGWYILFYTYWYRNAYRYIYIQCIYIYILCIYMYVSKCVYITDIYRYMYIDISIHIQLYVYIYIYVCVCIRSGEWEDGPCPAGQKPWCSQPPGLRACWLGQRSCTPSWWRSCHESRSTRFLAAVGQMNIAHPKEENLPHFGL